DSIIMLDISMEDQQWGFGRDSQLLPDAVRAEARHKCPGIRAVRHNMYFLYLYPFNTDKMFSHLPADHKNLCGISEHIIFEPDKRLLKQKHISCGDIRI